MYIEACCDHEVWGQILGIEQDQGNGSGQPLSENLVCLHIYEDETTKNKENPRLQKVLFPSFPG